jgi:hypothetical protein
MNAQVSFAKDRGIDLILGNPLEEKPGKNMIFPSSGSMVKTKEIPLDDLRRSYLKKYKDELLFDQDYRYLQEELNCDIAHIKHLMEEINETKK